MAPWRVRDFHDDDLDAAIRLWEDRAAGAAAPVFGLSDLIAAVRAGAPAVVAVAGEDLAGSAVATVSGAQAWLMRISLAPAWRQRGIGSAMLTELERRLVAAGVHRITCLLADEAEMGALALEHCGYTARREMIFYERVEPVGPADVGILDRLGGRMIRAGTWDQLGGMAKEKELIERRVILPLAHPQLADRLGLVPPRAVILFGPPGTGKTSFAKGVASRLGWPFAELFPSRLAGDSPAGLASALREAFTLVAELDKVVVFIDEVEEIAGLRQPRTVSVAQGVTNEMLKLIPPFRERDESCSSAPPTRSATWTPRSCATAGSTTSSRSARPTNRPGRRSGTGTSPRCHTLNSTWRPSSPSPGCSPRPTSSSPPAGPPSWCSSGSCSNTARNTPRPRTSCAGSPKHAPPSPRT
jgi:GNAT superfamily N-acetyltransferase